MNKVPKTLETQYVNNNAYHNKMEKDDGNATKVTRKGRNHLSNRQSNTGSKYIQYRRVLDMVLQDCSSTFSTLVDVICLVVLDSKQPNPVQSGAKTDEGPYTNTQS